MRFVCSSGDRGLIGRGLLGLVVLSLSWTASGGAQDVSERIAEADAAFDAGDYERAEAAYREAIAIEPGRSRPYYQLARLEPAGTRRGIRLLERYVELEPAEAWGWLALGEGYAAAGEGDRARAAYDRAVALAPAARDVALARARHLVRTERTDAAIAAYEAWVAIRPADAAVWRELGRERQRAGRMREAARALERARALEADPAATAGRLAYVRARAAPSVAPFGGGSKDSDDNLRTRGGVELDAAIVDRVRLGLVAQRTRVEADPDEAPAEGFVAGPLHADRAHATLAWRPRRTTHVQARVGVARVDDTITGEAWTTADVRLRARYRAPARGPAVEVRLRRRPIDSSPALLARENTLLEARATLEVPLAGVLRLRGAGRAGRLSSPDDENDRLGWTAAAVLVPRPVTEISLRFDQWGYDDTTIEPYFAPERVQTADVGLYTELYADNGSYLALDVGGGLQRVEEFGREIGDWDRALRLWTFGSLALRPNVALEVEGEAYDLQIGEAAGAVTTTERGWQYGSVSAGLRWWLR